MSIEILNDGPNEITISITPLISGDVLTTRGKRFAFDLDKTEIPAVPFPLDFNHRDLIGQVTEIKKNATGGLDATAKITSYASSDVAANVMARLRAGLVLGASPTFGLCDVVTVEYEQGETAKVNGRAFIGPIEIYENATLDGAAITPYPADKKTLSADCRLLQTATQGERTMSDEVKTDQTTEEKKKECSGEETVTNPYPKHPDLQKFLEAFPDRETAIEYYLRGLTLEEAQAEDYKLLKEKRKAELSAAESEAEADEEEKKELAENLEGEEKKPEPKQEEKKELARTMKRLDAANVTLKKQIAELSRRIQTLTSGTFGEDSPVGSKAKSSPRPASALAIAAEGIAKRMHD